MKLKAIAFSLAALAILWTSVPAVAQQRGTVARIGFLCPLSKLGAPFDAFRESLRKRGWVEGQNLVIDIRYAHQKLERLPLLAADLVRDKVDVLVPMGPVGNRAATQATTAIPVVISAAADPVASGLVASLARPGGNVTGVSVLSAELAGERLELLKEIVPGLARLGVLWNPQEPEEAAEWGDMQAAARRLGLQLQSVEVPPFAEFADIEKRFVALGQPGPDALINLGWISASFFRGKALVKLAAKHHLPSMYARTTFVKGGGLISYGPNWSEVFRQVATYTDKVLKGTKPGNLPVEQPTKFDLWINMKTAKALGLTIPSSVLIRADRVIE